MRHTGFDTVRFHNAHPIEVRPGVYDFARSDAWFDAAQAEGIGVIYHATEGKRISDAMLQKHGLTRQQHDASFLDEPRMLAPVEETLAPMIRRYRKHPAMYMWVLYGEPGFGGRPLDCDEEEAAFAAWLKRQYRTLKALDAAWNFYPDRREPVVPSFERAWEAVAEFSHKAELAGGHLSKRNYGAARDLMRFHTDRSLARAKATIDIVRRDDAGHPIAVGSHQLFLNQPALRWDIGKWARLGDLHFSLIHQSWHFEMVHGEVDRPTYMQARLTRDYFKGGWTSAFETTGGAVQYSGGYGNSMTPGLMRRLTLSYLAAGNLAMAFWTWNHRKGGWEAGEYGLTTLSGAVSSWAKEAGAVSRGLDRYAAELWQAKQDDPAGILTGWDNQAIVMLEPQRHDLQDAPGEFARGSKTQASRACIGLARSLIDAQVPFEYLTLDELAEGIGLCYSTIYAPHMRAISREHIGLLADYVKKGGRLVADVQFGFHDQWGKLHRTGKGGPHEWLFGAYIDTIHDTRTNPVRYSGMEIDGFYGDLVPTRAKVLGRFDHGSPAVTEHRLGRGTATLIAFDPARMCWRPGNPPLQTWLAGVVRGNNPRKWECDAPMAFRLSSPAADHYFLLNDGPRRWATIRAHDRAYTSGQYVIERRPIDIIGTIAVDLPERSGVWLRLARR